MPEREFKIRHTTEGADKAKADIEGIAQAEAHYKDEVAKLNALMQSGTAGDAIQKETKSVERAKGAVSKLSGATGDLNVKKENLTNILSRIHPSLGALADGLANAGEMAGALATKNLKLTGIMSGARAAVLKYKNALMLLGAGGAAVAAVMYLISVWRKLKAELEKILELQKKIDAQNRRMIDKAQSFRQRLVEAVESGAIAPPTEQEIARMRRDDRWMETRGVSPGVRFDIVTGQRAPLDERQLQIISGERGDKATEKRIQEEVIKDKGLSTKDVEYIKEQGFTEEDIEKIRNMLRYGEPKGPGNFFDRRSLTPDEFRNEDSGQLWELAARLKVLDVILSRLEQMSGATTRLLPLADVILGRLGHENAMDSPPQYQRWGLRGPFTPYPKKPSTEQRESAPKPEPVTQPKGDQPSPAEAQSQPTDSKPSDTAADLTEAAAALKEAADLIREQTRNALRAAEELHQAAEAQSRATDRAAAKLSRNGTTPKWQSLRGGEG